MILAGIFNPRGEEQLTRLKEAIQYLILYEPTFLNKGFFSFIAGKTHSVLSQGEIYQDSNHLLVGKVFKKDTYQPITIEDLKKQLTPKTLIDEYWGKYLFVSFSNEGVVILRDPVNQFPLFYTTSSLGEILFASELEILYKLMEAKPTLNLSYFSSYLLRPQFITDQTPFDAALELPQGCQLVLKNDGTLLRSVLWNPVTYCHNSIDNIQTRIIETASHVVESWIKETQSVFLELSGGTDSTGLLFLLNSVLRKDQALMSVNSYHPGILSSDERLYALAATKAVSRELTTFDISKAPLPFERFYGSGYPNPNWPSPTLIHLNSLTELGKLSKNYQNTVYTNGHGGDHVFIAIPKAEMLCDYLIERGFRGFYHKLKELSMMSRRPLFSILTSVFRSMIDYPLQSYGQPSLTQNQKQPSWFTKELFHLDKAVPYHPFFYEKQDNIIPPGKRGLIETIYHGLSTTKDIMECGTNPIFYPFFSQPILELALSIPTYDSFQNGYNRYHFRSAISKTFETDLVWRKDKGNTSGIFLKVLKNKEKRLLELCLEGQLIKTGLLDKGLLLKSIKDYLRGYIYDEWPIINLACSELFLEFW